jgi:hypothetical protein
VAVVAVVVWSLRLATSQQRRPGYRGQQGTASGQGSDQLWRHIRVCGLPSRAGVNSAGRIGAIGRPSITRWLLALDNGLVLAEGFALSCCTICRCFWAPGKYDFAKSITCGLLPDWISCWVWVIEV